MNLLLDTHALLWWLEDNPKLSKKARNVIKDGENLVFISAAAIWEITIKTAIGKLEISDDFPEALNTQSFLQLNADFRKVNLTLYSELASPLVS